MTATSTILDYSIFLIFTASDFNYYALQRGTGETCPCGLPEIILHTHKQ
jgi:hypothetical protein